MDKPKRERKHHFLDLTEHFDVNFTEKSKTGGNREYTHRWRALKPGIVTIWLEELNAGYDAENLTKEFAPKACYIIDENLRVTYSKEDTKKTKQKYKQAK